MKFLIWVLIITGANTYANTSSVVEYEACTDDLYCYEEYIVSDGENTACLSEQTSLDPKYSFKFLECKIDL